MTRWFLGAFAGVVGLWGLLSLMARRLPEGLLRDLAQFLPACADLVRKLRRDARVPLRAKIALAFAALWVLSPIDLIPEFLPIIGPLDDVLVVTFALRYAARAIPREALFENWSGNPRLLERILGCGR